jgi:4-hydroxybenzoate polyprenyltransferase
MPEKSNYYPPYTFSYWKAYFIQMRPYLLFVSGIAGWAGMSIVFQESFNLQFYILGLISFFLAYGFGQALTDCFQMDTDSISAPSRPLSKGLIGVKAVMITSISGLIIVSAILVYINIWNVLICLLSIIGLATYSIVKKRYWFGGPFYNAWIVALLPIMGYISITGESIPDLSTPGLSQLVIMSFFSYASFVLIGYLKDISADRETGYRTLPVVFGWNTSVWINNIFIILSIAFCFSLVKNSILGITCMAMSSGIAISGQLYAHLTKIKEEHNAVFPITSTVRSFILWHIAVILTYYPEHSISVAIFYFLFEVALYLRPDKEQI